MKFQMGAMSAGDILDRGLKILLRRFGTFLAITAILFSPVIVWELVSSLTVGGGVLDSFILFVVNLICQSIEAAALVYVVAKEYVDEPVTVNGAISFAFRRFGPLILTSFLVGIVTGIGLILLIVPGLIFATWYAFASQAVVLEGLSGQKAMDRSKSLTEGYRWRIFGLILLFWILLIGITLAITFGLGSVLPPGEFTQNSRGQITMSYKYPNYLVYILVDFLLRVCVGAFQAACMTLLYFDLRVRKEGFDLEVAAKQATAPAEMR